MIEIINRSRLAGQALKTVQRVLAGCGDVDQIFGFVETQASRFGFWSAVAYRDHSHDLILARAADPYFFVFDTTCSGTVRGVTIWDQKPSIHDLKRVRAERRRQAGKLWPPDCRSSHERCRFGCEEHRTSLSPSAAPLPT